MKSTYIIIAAIVVIVIIIGGVFAYISLSGTSSPSPTPTPTPAPTASPTAAPTGAPTTAPTTAPTAAPTTTPTPAPTAAPTPTPAPTQLASAQIAGSGGSLVNPVMQDWTAAYQALQTNVQVGYTAEGSGKGITHLAQQLYDFGESDVPLQASDLTANPILANSSVLTIPISASAVVPAYNIKLLNGTYCQNGLNFTGTVLANIFLGTITTWNDPQIANLQSPSVAAQLPSTPAITVVHRSDSSGTMYAFSDYLCQVKLTMENSGRTAKQDAQLASWFTG